MGSLAAAAKSISHQSDRDALVACVYRVAAGLQPWQDALHQIALAHRLWVVQLFGMNKQSGTVLFSFEGGSSKPETAFDWFHKYHRIDPRAALVAKAAVGDWIACDEHFDDRYVSTSPFYQQFLIPHGGRYVYGAKVLEDESRVVIVAFHRGNGTKQLDACERAELRAIAAHIRESLVIQESLGKANVGAALGLAVLDAMRPPLIVLDAKRKIVMANGSARAMLKAGDPITDRGGYAICRDTVSDVDLMYALRQLVLTGTTSGQPASTDRLRLRLRTATRGRLVAATLLALRPNDVLGAFGDAPVAMLVLYEPGMNEEPDPFVLQATFELTPAEGRVAALLAAGRSVKQIASHLGVSAATVRSHLNSIFDKTNTRRQVDLVRALMFASNV